jgi:hypothetical protein
VDLIFYALVASDTTFAVDLFPSRTQADSALTEVLTDEPDYADLLKVVAIDLSGSDVVAASLN